MESRDKIIELGVATRRKTLSPKYRWRGGEQVGPRMHDTHVTHQPRSLNSGSSFVEDTPTV
jgi:hypothetical protein